MKNEIKPKRSKWKEIRKSRAEINKWGSKRTIQRKSEQKS
jgi:hypothetical protein